MAEQTTTSATTPKAGIVDGTDNPERIDIDYMDDPEGDRVTTGDDTIEAGGGDDTIFADLGNDEIHAGDGDDYVSGGFGDDTITGGLGNDPIFGNEGNDSMEGGDGADSIYGETGDDYVSGGAGDDHLEGNEGDDTIFGGDGNDWMRGSYGNDELWGGAGDDYLWGGWADDTFHIENGFGNDTIDAEGVDASGNSGGDNDVLDLSLVTDDLTIDLTGANPEDGTFSDGTSTAVFNEIEHIVLGSGSDTLILGDESGQDVVEGFVAPTLNPDGSYSTGDLLDVSDLTSDSGTTPVNAHDVTVSDDGGGSAVLSFPGGESITLIGVDPAALSTPEALEALGIPAGSDGIVSGTDGGEFIGPDYTDADGDMIDGGDAVLPGERGDDDIVQAGAGDDTIFAGDGNDEVEAGLGNDQAFGGTGNDFLDGGDGDDSLYGDAGADTLSGGDGADMLDGGDDRDVFIGVGAGDDIYGGEGGDDHDILNLSGAGPYTVNYETGTTETGTIDFLDADGAVTGTLSFDGIEEIVPCFTPGTLIQTIGGAVPVEDLAEGDKVVTRDHGFQEIRWTGRRHVNRAWLNIAPDLQPVVIRKDALGDGVPARDLAVSPNHRMLIHDGGALALFGDNEVLAAAKHLVGLPGVTRGRAEDVTYVHFLFDHHEVVYADNAWSESFQPGEYTMANLAEDQRDEIFALFPELEMEVSEDFDVARRVLKRHEAALMRLG